MSDPRINVKLLTERITEAMKLAAPLKPLSDSPEVRAQILSEIDKYVNWLHQRSLERYTVVCDEPKATINNNELSIDVWIKPVQPLTYVPIKVTNADGTPLTAEQWAEICAELEAEGFFSNDIKGD